MNIMHKMSDRVVIREEEITVREKGVGLAAKTFTDQQKAVDMARDEFRVREEEFKSRKRVNGPGHCHGEDEGATC